MLGKPNPTWTDEWETKRPALHAGIKAPDIPAPERHELWPTDLVTTDVTHFGLSCRCGFAGFQRAQVPRGLADIPGRMLLPWWNEDEDFRRARPSARLGGRPAVFSPSMAAAGAAVRVGRWWSAPAALASLVWGSRVISDALPDVPGRRGLASRLAVRGLGWSLRQESALLLRHWWPATLVACMFSGTACRMVVAALLVDTAVALREGEARITTLLGRRLDDLAYGAGLWIGSMRSRSLVCLLPRVARVRRRGLSGGRSS
jgi:hypothetical protein